MSQSVETPTKALPAGGALGQYILVKFTSDVLSVAALGEEPIGVMQQAAFAAGEVCNVRLLSAQGTMKCFASAAVAQGAVVYGRAAGKVDDDSGTSAIRIGIALEAATAAGDIIEVLPC